MSATARTLLKTYINVRKLLLNSQNCTIISVELLRAQLFVTSLIPHLNLEWSIIMCIKEKSTCVWLLGLCLSSLLVGSCDAPLYYLAKEKDIEWWEGTTVVNHKKIVEMRWTQNVQLHSNPMQTHIACKWMHMKQRWCHFSDKFT